MEDSQAAERLLSLSLMKGATLWKRRSAQRSQPVGPNAIEQTWSQLAKLGKPPKCAVTCATMQKSRASCSDGAAPCARGPAQARPAPSDSLPACRRRPGPFSSCLCISLPCSSHQLWVRWTPFPFSFFSAALSEQRGKHTNACAVPWSAHPQPEESLAWAVGGLGCRCLHSEHLCSKVLNTPICCCEPFFALWNFKHTNFSYFILLLE